MTQTLIAFLRIIPLLNDNKNFYNIVDFKHEGVIYQNQGGVFSSKRWVEKKKKKNKQKKNRAQPSFL